MHPKELQKLLAKIEETPEEGLISRLDAAFHEAGKIQRRSARGILDWRPSIICHFTSPIRRYPDLQIHRIIKDNLRGRMNEKRIEHYWKDSSGGSTAVPVSWSGVRMRQSVRRLR